MSKDGSHPEYGHNEVRSGDAGLVPGAPVRVDGERAVLLGAYFRPCQSVDGAPDTASPCYNVAFVEDLDENLENWREIDRAVLYWAVNDGKTPSHNYPQEQLEVISE